jgi:hypothetical protein
METQIEPRKLEPSRLAEIEQVALAREDEDARMLHELLSHAAYCEMHQHLLQVLADAVARTERDRSEGAQS